MSKRENPQRREKAILEDSLKRSSLKKSKLKNSRSQKKIMSAKVQIIGNLGRDPETRVNANNTFIANFSFASNNQRKSATGETVKKADWYNITATGKQAQILAKHVRKGDPLLIEGRQTLSEWTDREGNSRKSVDVLVQDFRFLGRGNSRTDENQAAPETAGSHDSRRHPRSDARRAGRPRFFGRQLPGDYVIETRAAGDEAENARRL